MSAPTMTDGDLRALHAQLDAENAIAEIETAAQRVGAACRAEMELEDERSVLKPQATRRIMTRDSLAATPAEKLVETDEEYASHRRRQAEAVVEKHRAFGGYEAAKLRAKLFVALATEGR
jgi:hypothetical protein